MGREALRIFWVVVPSVTVVIEAVAALGRLLVLRMVACAARVRGIIDLSISIVVDSVYARGLLGAIERARAASVAAVVPTMVPVVVDAILARRRGRLARNDGDPP
jgi:hypothetical protein